MVSGAKLVFIARYRQGIWYGKDNYLTANTLQRQVNLPQIQLGEKVEENKVYPVEIFRFLSSRDHPLLNI